MTRLLQLLILPLLIWGCTSPDFYLQKSDTGKILGPFNFVKNSEFQIPEGRYIVIQASTRQRVVQEVLSETIVPEVDFQNVSTTEALAVVWRHVAPEHDVTYSINLDGYTRFAVNPSEIDKFDPFSFSPDGPMWLNTGQEVSLKQYMQMPPAITFSAHDISVIEAVEIICAIAELTFQIDGSVVKIAPRYVQHKNGR